MILIVSEINDEYILSVLPTVCIHESICGLGARLAACDDNTQIINVLSEWGAKSNEFYNRKHKLLSGIV